MNIKKILIFYPGGNITAIVQGKVSREDQAKTAQAIIDYYNKGKPIDEQIEQIAFEEKPMDKRAISRLQMSGGEFSGNAALCFAHLKIERNKEGLLEISGSDDLLQASKTQDGEVKVEMPETNTPSKLVKTTAGFPVISLPGIKHVLIADFFDKQESLQRKIGLKIIEENGFKSEPATGIIFMKEEEGTTTIKPYVYFEKGTKYDLYKETACGSATLAIGIYKLLRSGKQALRTKVIQPTGSALSVWVKRKGSKINSQVKGKVSIIYEGKLSVR